MPRHLAMLTSAVAALSLVSAGPASARVAAQSLVSATTEFFPSKLDLPTGFLAKGIAIPKRQGPTAYIANGFVGSVYRLNLATGKGKVTAPPEGTEAAGMRIDARGRLFVAGAYHGDGWVTDSRTGRVLKKYTFSDDPIATVPDVTVTPDAAYFTDAYLGQIYKVRFGPHGELPEKPEVLKVSGGGFDPSLVLGISTTPDGKALLISSVRQGKLYRVDPDTGAAAAVDLGDVTVPGMDGMVLDGTTLYATRVRQGTVVRIDLNHAGTKGEVITEVTDPNFQNPAALAIYGDKLYVTSTREFAVPTPGPDTEFWVTAVDKP